jgi:ribosomal peptide maturation radical SAM protein 1
VRVLLVTLPFASLELPNLALSTFKARLGEMGIDCAVAYLNLEFAESIGRREYQRVADGLDYWTFAGEWVFTRALYGADADPGADYADQVLRPVWNLSSTDLDLLAAARSAAGGFVDDVLRRVDWAAYDVVGFSSSNAQNIASLALARRVKEQHPRILTVFGGANWEHPMGLELHRRFPFVDVSCAGEADETFPQLLARLATGADTHAWEAAGVVTRRGGVSRAGRPAPPVRALDDLPIPDHSDYFAAASSLVPRSRRKATLETSRGCWWAERHCCRFCGLNSPGRAYRSKSPERIERELRLVAGRWPAGTVVLTDNVVPPAFLSDVLPHLAAEPLPIPLFLDARPDLSREDVRLLGCAHGMIQPGIESLSDHVLALMGKGSHVLENLRLLKWCQSYGVTAFWNIIHGIPGERDEDYDEMEGLVRSIEHLRPPVGCGPLRLDRYSPFYECHERYGIEDVRPERAYPFLYPFPPLSLRRIAYSFSYSCGASHPDPRRAAKLTASVHRWRRQFRFQGLCTVETGDGTFRLRDQRPDAAERLVRLNGLEQALIRACDDIAELDDLLGVVRERFGTEAPCEQAVIDALEELVQRRFIVRRGRRYLSLALPEASGWLYAMRSASSASASAGAAPMPDKSPRARLKT